MDFSSIVGTANAGDNQGDGSMGAGGSEESTGGALDDGDDDMPDLIPATQDS